MMERAGGRKQAEVFFEALWQRGDPWGLDASTLDQARYARLVAMLEGRRYARALELGCGAGSFTRLLAGLADRVVAVDIAPTAIARARAAGIGATRVDFHVADIMEYDLAAEGPWDLLVMSETIYYLGWVYPFCDIAWLAAACFAALGDGGRLLLVNTLSGVEDGLIRPWIIRTYRDLFVNVGFSVEQEEVLCGQKEGVEIEVLISLLRKAALAP